MRRQLRGGSMAKNCILNSFGSDGKSKGVITDFGGAILLFSNISPFLLCQHFPKEADLNLNADSRRIFQKCHIVSNPCWCFEFLLPLPCLFL